ncbi:hypothetical protein HYDPIDRAFT_113097 [Hydnomerulius pinastri MD-312]|uniref:Uncharacterized protein n=1 Tax=Hydnomerulius pinastri MD-312 TaxID=994086 RepID=A0A0C9VZ05_9AGAM|nr:hypothetical protein HYDPIDRAFT_113097 [Hydnomerulius pinastri MD-312]
MLLYRTSNSSRLTCLVTVFVARLTDEDGNLARLSQKAIRLSPNQSATFNIQHLASLQARQADLGDPARFEVLESFFWRNLIYLSKLPASSGMSLPRSWKSVGFCIIRRVTPRDIFMCRENIISLRNARRVS